MVALARVDNGIERAELEFSNQQIEMIRHSLGMDKATPLEFDLFLNLCKAKRLDPLTKQMYAVNIKGKWQFFASIDGLRVIAQRTGEYGGQTAPLWCGDDLEWREAWLENERPSAAKVGVYKRGYEQPTWGVATFKSYGMGKTNNWLTMPDVMLAKCAEAIALRKAFPDDLSALYVREEFEDIPERQINAQVRIEDGTPSPIAFEDHDSDEYIIDANPETGEIIDAEMVDAAREHVEAHRRDVWGKAQDMGYDWALFNKVRRDNQLPQLEDMSVSQCRDMFGHLQTHPKRPQGEVGEDQYTR